VKCDEAKPGCKRCLKWQGSCQGYTLEAFAPGEGRPVAAGVYPPIPKPDETQWEDIYFGHWSVLSATLGGGLFPSALFNETVPQLSRIEPAVRYAVIAIGALANFKAPNILPGASTSPEAKNPHYNNAIAYYGHALGLVRIQQDVCSDYTLRVAVICCVLFAAFEALYDSCDAALNHINHGLMMIDQIMCAAQQNTGDDAMDSPLRAQQPLPSPHDGDGSPMAFALVLDDELLQMFQRLEYISFGLSLLLGLPQPPRTYLRLSDEFDLSRPFTDLIQARRCLDQFQHACLRAVIPTSSGGNNPGSTLLPLLAPLEEWLAAFLPLAEQHLTPQRDGGDRTLAYYQAVSLLLQYHMAHVSLTLTSLLPYEDGAKSNPALDRLTPHYEEMVRLSETLMACQPREARSVETQYMCGTRERERQDKVFTMDHAPAMAVLMAAMSCSDANVRADALALLARYPQRDGFWDCSRVMSCVRFGCVVSSDVEMSTG